MPINLVCDYCAKNVSLIKAKHSRICWDQQIICDDCRTYIYCRTNILSLNNLIEEATYRRAIHKLNGAISKDRLKAVSELKGILKNGGDIAMLSRKVKKDNDRILIKYKKKIKDLVLNNYL